MPPSVSSDSRARHPPLSPSRVLALSFALLVGAGTFVLWLPASADAGSLSLIDAFFTAVSAVCVTGLIVVDTPVVLAPLGEATVLLLIQLGGLGYMTIATLVGISFGKGLTLQERRVLQEGLHVETMEDVVRFAATVLALTACFEAAGALALGLYWADDFGLARGVYLGLFHSVSAFNNAGFSLFSTNLVAYQGDLLVNLVVLTLVIGGGVGFLVLVEVGRLRQWRRFSMHTKLVLAMTVALIGAGTLAVFLLERSNPRTLATLPAGQAWLAALFQAVSPRTAGFNTLDVASLTTPTLFVTMALMFVGAGSGGTAGGIKVSTLAVTVLALWATARGDGEPAAFGRRLPADLVSRAFVIGLIGFLALNLVVGLLLITEGGEFLPILFEATSAFGTVGLSTGVAGRPVSLVAEVSVAGKLLVAAMMFAGRLGPLTLAVALAGRQTRLRFRYPEGKVLIG